VINLTVGLTKTGFPCWNQLEDSSSGPKRGSNLVESPSEGFFHNSLPIRKVS
jgi:hypothetical protein